MVKQVRHIDVSTNPELMRLVEEVAQTGDNVVLSKGSRELAMLAPIASTKRLIPRVLSPAEVEVFNSSAGGWADVDVDEFMKRVYEGRQSSKPRVDL
jgi:precorrin-6x reductase